LDAGAEFMRCGAGKNEGDGGKVEHASRSKREANADLGTLRLHCRDFFRVVEGEAASASALRGLLAPRVRRPPPRAAISSSQEGRSATISCAHIGLRQISWSACHLQ
jgi:hypothetical protein